eukprot:3151147-Amphidinium_carterae.1
MEEVGLESSMSPAHQYATCVHLHSTASSASRSCCAVWVQSVCVLLSHQGLDTVGFCGVDDSVDPAQLVNLSNAFPWRAARRSRKPPPQQMFEPVLSRDVDVKCACPMLF